jgi:hypothetical protein
MCVYYMEGIRTTIKKDCFGELFECEGDLKFNRISKEALLVLILEQLRGKKFKKLKGDKWKV